MPRDFTQIGIGVKQAERSAGAWFRGPAAERAARAMRHAGSMSHIERHGSGAPWESVAGYSRVVRAGDRVLVAGTTATLEDGAIAGLGDPGAQARQALANIVAALARVGAGPADVVRTRMFVTDISRWEEVARVH